MDKQFHSSFLPYNNEGGKIWLNFIPYAKRLLGETGDDIWLDPARFLALFNQSQGLLKSDVLGVPVLDFFSVYLSSHPEIAQPWTGKKTTFALRKLLALEKPRDFLVEVLEGLTNLFGNRFPIVLVVPSPQYWMAWFKEKEAQGSDFSVSSNEVDSISMYLADFLRNFSQSGLAGIVLDESVYSYFKLTELYELYQPILNIAQHYQWNLGLRLQEGLHLEDSKETVERSNEKVDFILYEGKPWSMAGSLKENGMVIGGGLDEDFWTGKYSWETFSFRNLAYGTIPKDANPEEVLEKLRELRNVIG